MADAKRSLKNDLEIPIGQVSEGSDYDSVFASE
jgi:hypothetical protein